MIRCRVSPFMPTYDLRRAVAAALYDAHLEQMAGEYFVKTETARDAAEALDSRVLPAIVELDWISVPERERAVGD